MADLYEAGLPWSGQRQDRLRFTGIVGVLAILFLVPALWIPRIELPEPERIEVAAPPPQLARLMAPSPEPERAEPPEPMPEPQPRPQPQKPEVVDTVAAPAPDPVPEVATPGVERQAQSIEQAREVASRSGLLALQGTLAQMRSPDRSAASALTANVADGEEAPAQELAETTLASSGGVMDEAAPEREIALAGHELRQVDAPGPAAVPVAPVQQASMTVRRGMNTIRQVFDGQKTALYSLYRRALRQDPTLAGKVVLELDIEPDGRVSRCEVVNSELDNPALEARLASRVLLFNFGAEEVERRTVRFPVEFLPS